MVFGLLSAVNIMKHILISVLLSAFVWPGTGQLYNREWKKAAILIILPLFFGMSLVLGVGQKVAPNIPSDISISDKAQYQDLRDKMQKADPGFFSVFQFLVFLTWAFGVADAYLGAREKNMKPQKNKLS